MRLSPEKPRTFDELDDLLKNKEVEVMLQEELDDGTVRLLVYDYRRTYEEGEIYELIL